MINDLNNLQNKIAILESKLKNSTNDMPSNRPFSDIDKKLFKKEEKNNFQAQPIIINQIAGVIKKQTTKFNKEIIEQNKIERGDKSKIQQKKEKPISPLSSRDSQEDRNILKNTKNNFLNQVSASKINELNYNSEVPKNKCVKINTEQKFKPNSKKIAAVKKQLKEVETNYNKLQKAYNELLENYKLSEYARKKQEKMISDLQRQLNITGKENIRSHSRKNIGKNLEAGAKLKIKSKQMMFS